MRVYHVAPGAGIEQLASCEFSARPLAPEEVRVGVCAIALNRHDLALIAGDCGASQDPIVPCTEGSGTVIEVGSAVSRFAAGDHVVTHFVGAGRVDGTPAFPLAWDRPSRIAACGVLTEEIVCRHDALVGMPASLDFAEASTLPFAGVSAWNALFDDNPPAPGQTVLLVGTGDVSIWALQLAKAAGLRVFVLAETLDALQHAQKLGADCAVHHGNAPEWPRLVLQWTGGLGADRSLLEAGSRASSRWQQQLSQQINGISLGRLVEDSDADMLTRSLQATRVDGSLAVIDGAMCTLSRRREVPSLSLGTRRLRGVVAGSREMAEDLGRFISATGLRPMVDRTFPFAEARAAFRYLEQGRHVGRVVVRV